MTALTRRRFLLFATSGVVVVGAGACTGFDTPPVPSPPTSSDASTTVREDDVATIAFAASLEVLAVGTYATSVEAIAANRLGSIPPSLEEFMSIASDHHQAYRDAWNEKLQGRGGQAVTTADPTFESVMQQRLSRSGSINDIGNVLASLEAVLSANCLSSIARLEDSELMMLAASIHIADMQQGAVLGFLLGMNPVPLSFANDVFSLG